MWWAARLGTAKEGKKTTPRASRRFLTPSSLQSGGVDLPDKEVEVVREELDTLVSAEASVVTELGRASVPSAASTLPLARDSYVKRVAISVVLRWALIRLSSDLQLDSLLSSELGSFSAAVVYAVSGLVARHLATLIAEAQQPQDAQSQREPPPLSPELTLSKALGLGILSTASQGAIGASMSALFKTDERLLADIGQLVAGAAAGAVAGAASGPMDQALRKLEQPVSSAANKPPSPAAVQLVALADGLSFVALEALWCVRFCVCCVGPCADAALPHTARA